VEVTNYGVNRSRKDWYGHNQIMLDLCSIADGLKNYGRIPFFCVASGLGLSSMDMSCE
jgi:hypothetical protein